MEPQQFYEELAARQGEDRARLVMERIRLIEEQKKHKKWWQKLARSRKPKVTPSPWI